MRGVGVVLVVGVLAGCGGGVARVPVQGVSVGEGGRVIEVEYIASGPAGCREDPRVEVDESSSRVTVTVTVSVTVPDCFDDGVSGTVAADLERPLGERDVFDGATRRRVPVRAGR